jgi:hypothetical protein
MPDVMDRDELAALTRDVASLKAWCDSILVRVTRRQRALAAEGRAELPADLLAREGRQSGRDARTATDRERVCTAMPGFEDALASGSVSAGHVDALASVTRNLEPSVQSEFVAIASDLVADAEQFGVDQFERNCRDLVATSRRCTPIGQPPMSSRSSARRRRSSAGPTARPACGTR